MPMPGGTVTDLFQQRWSTYRRVVDHDLMEHRPLAGATAGAIQEWLAQRSPTAGRPRMADLGCGDLAQLAPLLRDLPLQTYTGVDLCAEVLPLAAARLEGVAYRRGWCRQDLLAWVLDPAEPADQGVDLVHTAYAVHHLHDRAKHRLLEGLRSRLAPGGLVLWADVFREAGESRASYLARYRQRIQQAWDPLSAAERQQVIDHISAHDHPADRHAIQRAAEACGWQWRWLWRGSHGAEALAMLTIPA
jgi:SAM-dependent methyltransferase